MKLSKDEQMDIRGDYATDSSWQFGLTTTTKKPSMLEGLKKREKIEPTELSDQTKFYEENIETIESGKPSSVNVRVVVRAGIRAGKEADEIIGDLMTRKFSSEVATKIVEREAAKLKGESGFLGEESSFVTHARKIIERAKQKTKSPEAKKVLEKTFNFNVIDEYARGPEFVAGRMGKTGKELKLNLDLIEQSKAGIAGDMKADFLKSGIPELSETEFKSFHDVIEKGGKPLNENVRKAYNNYVRDIDTKIVAEAKKVGLQSLTVGGRKVPFKEITIGKYFPRYLTETARQARDSLLSKIVAEKGVSYNKAFEMINDRKSEYYVRAQHQRLLSESADYEIAKDSITRHIDDMSKQIAAAKIFGPEAMEGAKFKELIAKIAKESGKDAETQATIIARDFLIPEYQRIGKYSKEINNALHTAASARYLTLFPISNLSNTILLFSEGTGKGMARATAKYLPYLEKNIENARRGGSLEQLSKIEYGPAKNLISKALGKMFDFSETHLRTYANEVGRESVIDRFTQLKKGGLSTRTTRLLKEGLKKDLLEDIDTVLKQKSLTEAQLRQAGFQMVKRTQGIISELSIPKVYRSQNLLIQQALMFKRFAGIQTGNIIKSAKANPAKFAVTFGVIAPVLGEVVGDLMSATRGTVAGLITDDTIKNAVEREVFEQRGKYYSQIVARLGVDNKETYDTPFGPMTQAQMIGRLIDNYNRAFVLGLIGDFMVGAAESPEGLTRGKFPGVDIVGEFTNDLVRLASVASEDIDIGEAAAPFGRSVERSIPFAGPAVTRAREAAEGGTGRRRLQGVLHRTRERRERRVER